jgi:GH25 family lysozyme M1 (1,4-beta-N-acetylmuramidase)
MGTKTILDVSRYQGNIDWQKVKASGKVDGVMLKTVSTNSCFGGIYIDPTFEANYVACKELGIPVGAYYYTYAQTQARADAELAKLHEALAGKSMDLPVAVDVEDNKLKPLSKAELTTLVAYAAKQIESWGLYAMVYTYTSYANTELDMDALAAYDLWIADYRGTRPTRKHGMWQYTSTGNVDSISGNVDLSYAYKDYVALIRRAGLQICK